MPKSGFATASFTEVERPPAEIAAQGTTALQPEVDPLSKPSRKTMATTKETGTSTTGVSGSLLRTHWVGTRRFPGELPDLSSQGLDE